MGPPSSNSKAKVALTNNCWKGYYHVAECRHDREQDDEEVDNSVTMEER